MSGYGPLQHIMGWLSSVGCFEAAADSFLLDIWEDFNFGFGRYEPLQHSIAWGGCPQLGGFEAAAADRVGATCSGGCAIAALSPRNSIFCLVFLTKAFWGKFREKLSE